MFAIGSNRGLKVVVVADIEDGGVSVAVATLSDGPAEILAAESATLPAEEHTPERSAASIATLLATTADKVVKSYMESEIGKKNGAPISAHAVVHAPWTHLRTALASDKLPAISTVTKDMIANLAKRALENPSNLDRSNILEAGVMKVFLNGYPTAAPLGKKAQQVSVVAFECDIVSSVKHDIEEAFGKILPGRAVSIHSGMRSFLTVLHEHLPEAKRYTIIDVHTNTTTASVLLKEEVLEETTVPIGIATIAKQISPSNGLVEETVSLLRMLASDTCSTPACEELKASLAKAEPEMVKIFADMLASLSSKRRLPNECVLSVRREFAPWLSAFFSRIDFSQFTTTTQPLKIELLTPEHLQDAVVWREKVVPETNIGVAAACVNILQHAQS